MSPQHDQLGAAAGPPAPIRTKRLVLCESEARDRAAFIDLFSPPEVGTYIGGAKPREELERATPEVPGQVPRDGGEAELGYLLLPESWGRGYAAEACAAVLGWFADTHPGEPVVLYTQTAHAASMRLVAKLGHTEVDRFEEFGAEQWSGVRRR